MTKLELKLIGVIILLIALFGTYVKYMSPDPVVMVNETGFNFSGEAEGLTEELKVEGIATPIIHDNDNMTNNGDIEFSFGSTFDNQHNVNDDCYIPLPDCNDDCYIPLPDCNDNMPTVELPDCNDDFFIKPQEKVALKSFPAYLYIGKRRIYQKYKITPQVKTDGNATARLTGTFTAFGEYDFDLSLKTIEEKSQKPNWLRPKIGAGWYGSKTKGIGMASVGVILFDTISINASGLSSGQLGVFAEYIF